MQYFLCSFFSFLHVFFTRLLLFLLILNFLFVIFFILILLYCCTYLSNSASFIWTQSLILMCPLLPSFHFIFNLCRLWDIGLFLYGYEFSCLSIHWFEFLFCPMYLTTYTVQVFNLFVRFLLFHFVSSIFLILLEYSVLIFPSFFPVLLSHIEYTQAFISVLCA